MYRLWKDRCDTQRATDDEDPYRSKRPDWNLEPLEDQRCRLIQSVQKKIDNETSQLLVVDEYKLILPAGVDILPKDRIKEIRLFDGTVLGPFKIINLLGRRDMRGFRLQVATLEAYG